jgi:hypothetical protein
MAEQDHERKRAEIGSFSISLRGKKRGKFYQAMLSLPINNYLTPSK